jgi:hypothetical protein
MSSVCEKAIKTSPQDFTAFVWPQKSGQGVYKFLSSSTQCRAISLYVCENTIRSALKLAQHRPLKGRAGRLHSTGARIQAMQLQIDSQYRGCDDFSAILLHKNPLQDYARRRVREDVIAVMKRILESGKSESRDELNRRFEAYVRA